MLAQSSLETRRSCRVIRVKYRAGAPADKPCAIAACRSASSTTPRCRWSHRTPSRCRDQVRTRGWFGCCQGIPIRGPPLPHLRDEADKQSQFRAAFAWPRHPPHRSSPQSDARLDRYNLSDDQAGTVINFNSSGAVVFLPRSSVAADGRVLTATGPLGAPYLCE